jgi:hypothetical protein
MRRHKRFSDAAAWYDDPMNGLSNLFDTAIVFALGFLLALVASYSIQEMLDPQSTMTMVKNPGDPNMQIIIKDMDKIQVLNMTGKIAGGQGTKMGTAYLLESGQVVYVPENATASNGRSGPHEREIHFQVPFHGMLDTFGLFLHHTRITYDTLIFWYQRLFIQ